MIAYFIKSGLCLALLLLFYRLVLEREKMHQFNRFYLLGSVLFSFLAPLFIIYIEANPEIVTFNNIQVPESHNILISQESTSLYDLFLQYSFVLYLVVTSILFIRFCVGLFGITYKIRTHSKINYSSAKIVLVEDLILPHTFWNYIFINREDYEKNKIEKEVFTHELAHVMQRHTLDVLIVEVLQIVLWFNPFFYPLKRAIQLNHEFLADDNVLASHNDISGYQYLLLDKAAWKNNYYLASNLNYSLTKKRLLMMKTQNSKMTVFLKKIAVIPLLAGLAFVFANRVEAQTTKKDPPPKPVIIEVVEDSEATKAEMKEYREFMRLVDQSKKKDAILKLSRERRLRTIYNSMSSQQKKTVIPFNKLYTPISDKDKEALRKKIKKKLEATFKKILKKESKKPPKPVKIEVLKRKKSKKEQKEEIVEVEEVIIEEVEEIVEVPIVIEEREVVEEREVEEVEEIKELRRVVREQEIEVVEELKEVVESEANFYAKRRLLSNYETYKKDGATFYLNGKKISERKAKKYFENKADEIKDIEIQKDGKKVLKVDINTK